MLYYTPGHAGNQDMGGKNMRTVIIFGSVHKIFFFGIKYLFIMTGI